jgi:hypothetical protein
MDGFKWWASSTPRDATLADPATTPSLPTEPRAESIGSVPFMRASRRVAAPSKTMPVAATVGGAGDDEQHFT